MKTVEKLIMAVSSRPERYDTDAHFHRAAAACTCDQVDIKQDTVPKLNSWAMHGWSSQILHFTINSEVKLHHAIAFATKQAATN